VDRNDLLILTNRIEEEIRRMADGMAIGSAADFGEYKYLAGTVRGLRITLMICQDALRQLEANDE
jgi:hypothetical protein